MQQSSLYIVYVYTNDYILHTFDITKIIGRMPCVSYYLLGHSTQAGGGCIDLQVDLQSQWQFLLIMVNNGESQ